MVLCSAPEARLPGPGALHTLLSHLSHPSRNPGEFAVRSLVHDPNAECAMRDFAQDLRFALRTLRKTPAFTSLAIVTIALGVGANTAAFSMVRGVLIRR